VSSGSIWSRFNNLRDFQMKYGDEWWLWAIGTSNNATHGAAATAAMEAEAAKSVEEIFSKAKNFTPIQQDTSA
jgi:hypothetical protein